jgi:hypothetical protein
MLAAVQNLGDVEGIEELRIVVGLTELLLNYNRPIHIFE